MLVEEENARNNALFNTQPAYTTTHDPEMEFLDINLTKDSSLLLHAIQIPFY
jgi:hypothetical protein